MAQSFWGWLAGRPSSRPARRRRPGKRRRLPLLVLELLESRDVPSTLTAQPDYLRLRTNTGPSPFGSPGATGYSPAQIKQAYGINNITFNGGKVAGDGTGTTIAIVDAFDDPNIANDLTKFDANFGLPDLNQPGGPTFTKMDENGGTNLPGPDSGWISEIALDVEWAHAIAPKASILLVEAASATYQDLLTAVGTAASQPGVVVVSMSWGGSEFGGETSFDSYFQTPSGHGGVTFVASSGDSGAPASYPAASPYVLAVGGTTLNLNSAGNILSESGWSGSGGGISTVEAQPGYQNGVVTQSSTFRANPDVAYDADPNTGFPVYDTYNNTVSAPWSQFGGTSDAAPQWAALIAIADQGRALSSQQSLDGFSQTLPDLYALPQSDFHDITTGTSLGSPHENAGPGYDLVTGRGTPVADKIVAALVGPTTPTTAQLSVTTSAAANDPAGTSFSVTVTALDASGKTVPTYTGTVHFTSSDPQAGLPGDYQFTAADAGAHTFSVTLDTAGGQTVTATDTASSAVKGSATVTVVAAAANKLAFGQQPGNAITGEPMTSAVTVKVEDAYGNLITGDNSDQVALSLGGGALGATLGGATTATASGGVATFNNLTVSAAGTGYQLTAASGTFGGATSATFNVTDPVATHFTVTTSVGTGNDTAGTAFSATVTVLDANNFTVPKYTGTIHFTSSDTQAVLPGNYQFTAADAGAHTFTNLVTLDTAGSQTATATDTASSAVKGSATVTVVAAAASKLAFGQQPGNVLTGVVIAPAVTVKVEDAYNNLVTADNSDQVKLTLGGGTSGATLGGTTTATASGGVATFNNLTVSAAGTGYQLTAASGTLNGATSATFNVTNTVASQFSVTTSVGTGNDTAGTAFSVTVTALDASGNTVPTYTGIVHFTSSDKLAGLPGDYQFTASDAGAHTFTNLVTLDTAGGQTVTATDTASSSVKGSATVTVVAAAANKLAFGQQPTATTVGSPIAPAVTVLVEDAYNNLVSADNSDQVTLTLGGGAAGATLGGTTTATASGGVATFGNLTVSAAGTGYQLTATSGTFGGATSTGFNVAPNPVGKVIEGFENRIRYWNYVLDYPHVYQTPAAAHDGAQGLDTYNGNGWVYLNDSAHHVKAGDTLSVWLQFSGAADGRAYFAFGATNMGTLSLVAAPNTGQLILQQNLYYGFQDLATVNQTYQANHWYRLEVDWGTSGKIVGKLFDSDGATLLSSVLANSTTFTAGGIGFRAIGSDKYWDTVTDAAGVNNFTARVPTHAGPGTNSADAGMFAELVASGWQPGAGGLGESLVFSPWGTGHSSQTRFGAPVTALFRAPA